MGFTKEQYLEIRQKDSIDHFKNIRRGKRELSNYEKETFNKKYSNEK